MIIRHVCNSMCLNAILTDGMFSCYNKIKDGDTHVNKVNKVTVAIDEDEARITLYKTNTKLAEFSNYDIDVPPFDISGAANKTVYQSYCKDLVINLLQNGCIDGYYYEEKQKSEDTTVGRKFGTGEFGTAIRSKLVEILDTMEIQYKIRDGEPEVTERYKGDRMVKNGSITFDVEIDGIHISVLGEIKSGQICKPKHYTFGGTTYTLNETNLKRLVKQNK